MQRPAGATAGQDDGPHDTQIPRDALQGFLLPSMAQQQLHVGLPFSPLATNGVAPDLHALLTSPMHGPGNSPFKQLGTARAQALSAWPPLSPLSNPLSNLEGLLRPLGPHSTADLLGTAMLLDGSSWEDVRSLDTPVKQGVLPDLLYSPSPNTLQRVRSAGAGLMAAGATGVDIASLLGLHRHSGADVGPRDGLTAHPDEQHVYALGRAWLPIPPDLGAGLGGIALAPAATPPVVRHRVMEYEGCPAGVGAGGAGVPDDAADMATDGAVHVGMMSGMVPQTGTGLATAASTSAAPRRACAGPAVGAAGGRNAAHPRGATPGSAQLPPLAVSGNNGLISPGIVGRDSSDVPSGAGGVRASAGRHSLGARGHAQQSPSLASDSETSHMSTLPAGNSHGVKAGSAREARNERPSRLGTRSSARGSEGEAPGANAGSDASGDGMQPAGLGISALASSLAPATDLVLRPDPPSRLCHCKKSQCLKLYCDCFAAGAYCVSCSCTDCYNRPQHADLVQAKREHIMQRDPKAFQRKILRDEAAGERHKKGCNCKRSHCLKKYCECYQGGVKCSHTCKCLDCRNVEDADARQSPGPALPAPPRPTRVQRAAAHAAVATLAASVRAQQATLTEDSLTGRPARGASQKPGQKASGGSGLKAQSSVPLPTPHTSPGAPAGRQSSDGEVALAAPVALMEVDPAPAPGPGPGVVSSQGAQGGALPPVSITQPPLDGPPTTSEGGAPLYNAACMLTPPPHVPGKMAAGMVGVEGSGQDGCETMLQAGLRSTPATLQYPHGTAGLSYAVQGSSGVPVKSPPQEEGPVGPVLPVEDASQHPLAAALQLLHNPAGTEQQAGVQSALEAHQAALALAASGATSVWDGMLPSLMGLGTLGYGLTVRGLYSPVVSGAYSMPGSQGTGGLGSPALATHPVAHLGGEPNGVAGEMEDAAADALLHAPPEELGPEEDESGGAGGGRSGNRAAGSGSAGSGGGCDPLSMCLAHHMAAAQAPGLLGSPGAGSSGRSGGYMGGSDALRPGGTGSATAQQALLMQRMRDTALLAVAARGAPWATAAAAAANSAMLASVAQAACLSPGRSVGGASSGQPGAEEASAEGGGTGSVAGSGGTAEIGGVHALVSPVRTTRRPAGSSLGPAAGAPVVGAKRNLATMAGVVDRPRSARAASALPPTSPRLDALACVAAAAAEADIKGDVQPLAAQVQTLLKAQAAMSPRKRAALVSTGAARGGGAGSTAQHPTYAAAQDQPVYGLPPLRSSQGSAAAAQGGAGRNAVSGHGTLSAPHAPVGAAPGAGTGAPSPAAFAALKAQASDYIASRCRAGSASLMPGGGLPRGPGSLHASPQLPQQPQGAGHVSAGGGQSDRMAGGHLPTLKSETSSLSLAALPQTGPVHTLAPRPSTGSGALGPRTSAGAQNPASGRATPDHQVSGPITHSVSLGAPPAPVPPQDTQPPGPPTVTCVTPWTGEAGEPALLGTAGLLGDAACVLSPLAGWDTCSLLLSPRVTTPLYTKGGQSLNSPFFALGSPTLGQHRWWASTSTGAAGGPGGGCSGMAAALGATSGAAAPLQQQQQQQALLQLALGAGGNSATTEGVGSVGAAGSGGEELRTMLSSSTTQQAPSQAAQQPGGPAGSAPAGGAAPGQLLRITPGTTLVSPGGNAAAGTTVPQALPARVGPQLAV